MSELYDVDVLAWSERQSELLRRHVAGEMLNEALDWPNIIEELESVGREQLHAVESLLLQAFVHELKAQAWPEALDVEKWLFDAKLFRAQASLRLTVSMRQRLDVQALYAKALCTLPVTLDGLAPQPVPQTCPSTMDELLGL